MTTLKDLAPMLDAATRPSQELDVAAFQALFPATRYEEHCPPLTFSIDAALALVERLLPEKNGWLFGLSHVRAKTFRAYVGRGVLPEPVNAPTAPLAILRALVAALIAQEKTDEA